MRRAAQATVLGFGFFYRGNGEVGIRVDPKALQRMRQRLRRLTGRSWRISMKDRIRLVNAFIQAWCAYFRLAETPSVFGRVDSWLRRRLRQVRWKEWKRPRTRRRNLQKLGIPAREAQKWANTRAGYWRIAGSAPLARALPNSHWETLGLTTFSERWRQPRFAW